MKTICVTGHRPKTLYGYDLTHPKWRKLFDTFQSILIEKKCTMAITGMALGVDTVFGQAVLDLRDNKNYDIGLLCAVPCFHYQEKWFNKTDIENFENLLKKANRVVYVTEDEYQPYVLERRNHFMVDNSDEILAVWNGKKEGGTYHCIKYAERMQKPITNIINQKGEIVYAQS